MKKEKTAIDWLISELFNQGLFDSNKAFSYTNIYRLVRQAKELEKKEIINSWYNGWINESPMIDENNCGEQFYNENYEHQTTD
jgi:hypothetical protein